MELRELLSQHLERLYGVRYDPAYRALIAVGVSEGLQDALIATLEPGDEVIVPEPCFMAYQPNVIFAGGRAGVRAHLLRARFRGDGRRTSPPG